MRLWHKDLIGVLPDKQLQGQWRECCLIAKALHDGNLNHLLVNKVKEYPIEDFINYTNLVCIEMRCRGKNPIWANFSKYFKWDYIEYSRDIFDGWHNDRYLKQCYYNLQEKYDCGGISFEEWQKVVKRVSELLGKEL